jgi:uncharacterized protein YfaS (alpha-2-macroglobulin family)
MIRSPRFLAIKKVLFVALLAGALFACKRQPQQVSNSANYVNYISAYTSGLVSKEASVRIVLAKPSPNFSGSKTEVTGEVLNFKPSIKGKLTWQDSQTLLFTPAADLEIATTYTAELSLTAIFEDVPADLETFTFNFQVLPEEFAPQNINLKTYNNTDLRFYRLEGQLLAADVALMDDVLPLLKATQKGKKLRITWQQTNDRKTHTFAIDSIARGEEASTVSLSWDDKVVGAESYGIIEIPALGDFKVLNVDAAFGEELTVRINFSDPLLPDQNLNGLISLGDADNLQFVIENTELRVFRNEPLYGEYTLRVFPGIKNAAGYPLPEVFETVLSFDDLLPAVELIGEGNIMPASGNLSVPFKAVNLSAVDVQILKIYSNNVPQFFQVNQLEGDYQLTRVGRPVLTKRIDLKAQNLKLWNNFSIDLAKIMKPEPGAIYRIEIRFKKEYSLYRCDGQVDAEPEDNLAVLEEEVDTEVGYDGPQYDYDYEYYDYYDYEDYDYRERDNPCNTAFYTSDRTASRNLLATNLAVIVKGADNGSFKAFVTDILTAKPVSGASVEFLSYQQQSLGKAKTDADGSVTLTLKGKPFLAIATHNSQFGYLRIDDGSSLSLSNFDVSGEEIAKGLKGFIYAERGVWRPGDSIFAQFMLDDVAARLPAGHPVIFEVRNPEGKLVVRQVKTNHTGGIYSFHFNTDDNAPTGYYSAMVKVGGARFYKSMRIETIKPNRLKVALTFDGTVLTGKTAKAKLHANWLTGAKAGGLKADINMQMRLKKEPFAKYPKFDFDDDTRWFYGTESEVFADQLDAQGDAAPLLNMGEYEDAPGMLEAVFISRVHEAGGDASFDRAAMSYAPFTHFVGIQPDYPKNSPWLQTDQPINVQLASVDAAGKPASRSIRATVYSIDWSWWYSSGRYGLSSYMNSSYAREVATKVVKTTNGKGNFTFKIDYPEWGQFLIRTCDEESGHCASQIVYVDWPMSRSRNGRNNPGAPTMLTFTADKEEYVGGEIAHLTIPTAKSGRLLLSIESGSKLISHKWLDAQEGQTVVDVPITDDMAPNVYAYVAYIQPHQKTLNDLPIRLYGVVPIKVNNLKTQLKPVIKTAEEWRPEQKATIKVSEEKGREMSYTLAIVDEGLLDITRFKTPNPWEHFYAREALGIKTWDYFDDIIGAFGGQIAKNFAIGGDEAYDPSGKKRLNRFAPVVKMLGPFTVKAGQEATHTFSMPNYVGSVRVMVVARHHNSYGNAEKAVPVRTPLMVLATLPRVVGPSEKVRIPVQVFAMKDNIKNVTINVKVNKLFALRDKTATLVFKETGDKMAYFEMDALATTGKGVIDVTATSGSEKATYQIAIEVRNPNQPETRATSMVLKPGETQKIAMERFGMRGTESFTLQASGIPKLNLASGLTYLLGYPHGCIEQTVSKAFPQLYLADVVQLTDAQQKFAKASVGQALKKLQNQQLGNGSWSLWAGSATVHDWASIYATHFIIEAEKKGFAIPSGMRAKAITSLNATAQNWQGKQSENYYYSYTTQAYRLYVLALSGKPNLGAMNRMRNERLVKEAAWRLASAYALAGQKESAEKLIKGPFASITATGYNPTFSNAQTASALMLDTYVLLKNEAEAFEQAKVLAEQLNSTNLYSSQGIAVGLCSMSKFLADKAKGELVLSWQAGNDKVAVKQPGQFYSAKRIGFADEMTVTNSGSAILYIELVQTGTPLPGKESVRKQGLQTSITYRLLDGTPLDVSEIRQGTDFKAIVTVTGTADKYKLYDMALTQVFPSGWEIYNTRLLDVDDLSGSSPAQYRDFRDDRVYTYFDLTSASRTYEVRLSASYIGKFYLSGPKVEAMYYPEIIAQSAGQWVEVVP